MAEISLERNIYSERFLLYATYHVVYHIVRYHYCQAVYPLAHITPTK